MADLIEIYICNEGQALKEGKLETTHDIQTKQDARDDAIERCRYDKKIFKIAYYVVNDEGGSKVFFTYNNPYYAKTTSSAPSVPKQAKSRERIAPARKPPSPKSDTLMNKILKGLGVK